MRKAFYTPVILCVLCVFCFLRAPDVHAGIINNFESAKKLVDNLSPAVGEYYCINTGELETIYSVSIYDLIDNDLHIGSIDLGYYNEGGILGILNFDLAGLNKISFKIPLGRIEPTLGFGAGYNFATEEWGFGPVLTGIKFKW